MFLASNVETGEKFLDTQSHKFEICIKSEFFGVCPTLRREQEGEGGGGGGGGGGGVKTS